MFRANQKYIWCYLIFLFSIVLFVVDETAHHQSTLGFLLNAAGLFLLIALLHVVFITPNAIAIMAHKASKKEVPSGSPSWLGIPLFILSWILVIKTLDYLRPLYKTFQNYTLTFF